MLRLKIQQLARKCCFARRHPKFDLFAGGRGPLGVPRPPWLAHMSEEVAS
jgi:hypothetical protein